MITRKQKYGINSWVVAIAAVAAVVLVNLFVTALVEKYPLKIDLTTAKIYELSDTTLEYLDSYETSTDIYYVAGESSTRSNVYIGMIDETLTRYAQKNSYINYQNINPAENPTFGTKYVQDGMVIQEGCLIVEAGERYKLMYITDLYNMQVEEATGRSKIASLKAEQKLNAALKYVSADTDYKAYIVKGHNEMQLGGLEEKLKDMSYEIGEVMLTTQDIPEDAGLLVIAAPTVDFTMAELAKLDAYFKNAGKAMIMLEYTSQNLPNLVRMVKEWGIEINDDVAIENETSSLFPQMGLVLGQLAESDVTTPLIENNRYVTYRPYSKSLTMLFESNNGVEVIPLMTTTENSYTTSDFKNLDQKETDKSGASVVAAVATKQGKNPSDDAIIYVSGNTTLLDYSETEVANYGFANYDYIANVLHYLQGSKEDYSVSPKELSADSAVINGIAALIIGIVFIVVLPLATLITGIVIWNKRRHL